jgi:dolichyl-phosphate-mannose-protein mannosyltransferase
MRVRRDVLWGWLGPAGVAIFAFALRVWHLGRPNELIFDETYYAKDAWSLLQHGYVQDYVENANDKIISGTVTGLNTGEPTWIVHPDGGKWLIAIGEHFFGMEAFGWRIAAVVAGALTVFILARMVRRLTGSTWIGCLAGMLLALDGVHFVMSRIALLDIFLTLWIVAGVAALVADRDWIERRLKSRPGLAPWRPWQLVAGISFGLACGTKWSGVWVLAAFGLALVVWELAVRRRFGQRLTLWRILAIGFPAFVGLVVLGLIVYLGVWSDFLVHHAVYEKRFGHGYSDVPKWGAYVDTPTPGWWGGFIDSLRSLWHFHVMTYDFHTGSYLAGKTHPYESHPIGWLVQYRPTSVFTLSDQPFSKCGAPSNSTCISEVLILGNPAVWWAGTVAVVLACLAWLRSRTWRWSVPILGVAATWLPWFLSTDRPIFSFYAVATVPFLIVAICLVIAGFFRQTAPGHRFERLRLLVWMGLGAYLALVVAAFVYFWPIWTNQLVPYDTWYSRMWFTRWI